MYSSPLPIPYLRATSVGVSSGPKLSATMSRFCSGVQAWRRSARTMTSTGAPPALLRSILGVSSTSVTGVHSGISSMNGFDHAAIPRRNVPPPTRSDVRFQGCGRMFLFPAEGWPDCAIKSCKAGDGPVGRRLTCSDARVGYRRSDFRLGLVPVLRRASARSWPPSVAREFPTVDPSPASHDDC